METEFCGMSDCPASVGLFYVKRLLTEQAPPGEGNPPDRRSEIV